MLLNGPATYQQLKSKQVKNRAPKLLKYQNKDCKVCQEEEHSECLCLGSKFDVLECDFDYENDLPEGIEIQILYRSSIRVHYNTVKEAKENGYTGYNPKHYPRDDGFLYSFTGLRSDAKEMYEDILTGKENRVKLVKAETP